jgi:AcrR family transcriptional regulator
VEARTLKARQSEATRRKLVKTARRLFAKRGYADVSIEEIVRAAGVTRGALYYYFEEKVHLFGAVAVSMGEEIAAKVESVAAGEKRPEKRLEVGLQALLDVFLEPDVRRIILIDGPSVVGWKTWHEVDERYSLGPLRDAVEVAMKAGYLRRQPVEPVARMLLGAVNAAGLYMAEREDHEAARAEVGRALDTLVSGLKRKQ